MRWKVPKINDKNLKKYEFLCAPDILKTVLINRNVDAEYAKKLISYPYEMIEEPLELLNINNAANILCKAMNTEQPIEIFADYDCDGLTSGYILYTFLSCVGAEVFVHYPERKDGYGLNLAWCKLVVNKYKNSKIKPLVVTVDNGITKKAEVKYLRENDIDVLITDHHLPQQSLLPQNCEILDPHIDESTFGQYLCGAGVAWNLIRYIEKQELQEDYSISNYLIPILAIGTIADVMPLSIYNQCVILCGLQTMNSSNAPESIAMFREQLASGNVITPKTIGWELAPMLNACGRLNQITSAANFFYEDDKEKLYDILDNIFNMNEKRKELEKEAIKNIDKNVNLSHRIVIAIADKYPVGLQGLIAGKLKTKYGLPAIVLSSSGDTYSGSCRSDNISLNKLVKGAKEKHLIKEFGGHKNAGGIKIYKTELENFIEFCDNKIKELQETGELNEEQEPEILVDGYLSLIDINNTNSDIINKFAYNKESFPQPIFIFKHLLVEQFNYSKNNSNNICFVLKDTAKIEKKIWGWGLGELYKQLGEPVLIDIAGSIERDFRMPSTSTLRIVDIKASSL